MDEKLVYKKKIAFRGLQEVYNVKIFVMTYSLKIALKSPIAYHMPAICICLDNFSVAKNVQKISNGSS